MTIETTAEQAPVNDGGLAPELQTPASQVATATTENEPSTTQQSPAQGTDVTDQPDDHGGLQKRFSELTRQRRDAERRAVEAESAAATARAELDRIAAERTPAREEPIAEPVFESPEQYQRDMAAYTRQMAERSARDILAAQRQADERQRNETAIRAEQQRIQTDFFNRENAARQEMPDYDEVARNNDLQISAPMASAIARSAVGPKIAYHLGKNPAEAARIAALAPQDQFLEIGALSYRLSQPTAPRTSSAPAPIVPVKPTAGVARDLAELSMEEYAAQRRKH